jgi:hypothetical protein
MALLQQLVKGMVHHKFLHRQGAVGIKNLQTPAGLVLL